MHTLGMRALVLLDAEAGLAAELSYRARDAGLEAPIVVLLGEDHGEQHRTLGLPLTFEKFRALVARIGGAWRVG